MHAAIEWLRANWPWIVWPALTAIFNALSRLDGVTWALLEERHPRVHAVLRLLRAVGIDPVVASKALRDLFAAKAVAAGPRPWSDAPPAPTVKVDDLPSLESVNPRPPSPFWATPPDATPTPPETPAAKTEEKS